LGHPRAADRAGDHLGELEHPDSLQRSSGLCHGAAVYPVEAASAIGARASSDGPTSLGSRLSRGRVLTYHDSAPAGGPRGVHGRSSRRTSMASPEPGALKSLVDVERGIISREIFVSDAYGAQLDRSQWGLVEVARMENYKGTIWATWDQSAPSFSEYVGGYKLYLDLLLDSWDGREGGTEAIGGIHKWLIPCNWKFPAEN